jgi:hypothetical protein
MTEARVEELTVPLGAGVSCAWYPHELAISVYLAIHTAYLQAHDQ